MKIKTQNIRTHEIHKCSTQELVYKSSSLHWEEEKSQINNSTLWFLKFKKYNKNYKLVENIK